MQHLSCHINSTVLPTRTNHLTSGMTAKGREPLKRKKGSLAYAFRVGPLPSQGDDYERSAKSESSHALTILMGLRGGLQRESKTIHW
jgi:hypothetical protein